MSAQVLEGHLKDAKTTWKQWERGAAAPKVSQQVNLALEVPRTVGVRIFQHDGVLPHGQRRSATRH